MQWLPERGLITLFILLLVVYNATSLTLRHHDDYFSSTTRTPIRSKNGERSITLFASSSPSIEHHDIATDSPVPKNTCAHCSKVFDTRNSLFRHLRRDPKCSKKSEAAGRSDMIDLVKTSIAIQFGYIGFIADKEKNRLDVFLDDTNGTVVAEQAGAKLQHQLVETLKDVLAITSVSVSCNVEKDDSVSSMIRILGSTQSSLAKLRHRALAQENGCSAEGDVLFINLMVPDNKLLNMDLWTKVGQTMRKRMCLDEKHPKVELFALQVLGTEADKPHMHAERSATQYVYQYMLPLSWLPDASSLYDWWSQEDAATESTTSCSSHPNGDRRKFATKTPQSLRQLKQALRSAESRTFAGEKIRTHKNKDLKIAAGRFGALGTRERRAWHNFADPSLKGDASPNNEPVWRVVDRARVVDFVEIRNEATAIIEVRGDGFLKEQIRRIIGSAVAMTHGWLPADFFELATNSDTFVQTPVAPANRLCLNNVRYHFDEMQSDGLPFFEPHATRDLIEFCPSGERKQWTNKVASQHISSDSLRAEASWLRNLEEVVAPSIRKDLRNQQDCIVSSDATTCPELYESVLSELRRIVSNNLWPETSMARSTVIRNREDGDSSRPLSHGSFTIVNPHVQTNWGPLPLGNTLFPDLVTAVFDLEASFSQLQNATRITVDDITSNASIADRPASSHCAVNCNAQFTPHVDSGRGAGQKLSMIVGLGEYSGGELRVEGDSFDIQYQPLVFDGWKLRHWTNPFEGERFSLVWFTPESKN
eukprot:scaffold24_cov128-Cylindrotheca_fusiformis.AAC.27